MPLRNISRCSRFPSYSRIGKHGSQLCVFTPILTPLRKTRLAAGYGYNGWLRALKQRSEQVIYAVTDEVLSKRAASPAAIRASRQNKRDNKADRSSLQQISFILRHTIGWWDENNVLNFLVTSSLG
jgi:hypothetical protein